MLNTRQHQQRRRSPVALSVLAVFLLVAGNVSAATTHNKTYSETFPHPCNVSEQVVVDGQEHFTDSSKINETSMHINTHRRVTGKGTGVPSSTQYVYGDQLKINMKVPTGNAYFRSWKKVISKSSGVMPDFMLLEIIHIKPDGQPGQTKTESRCK